MSSTSFRSRCPAGSKKVRNRRAFVTAVPDPYQPHVLVGVLESFDDFPEVMQRPDGPAMLPPKIAIKYAQAIIEAAEACLEGQ